jgi:hypothetical protein
MEFILFMAVMIVIYVLIDQYNERKEREYYVEKTLMDFAKTFEDDTAEPYSPEPDDYTSFIPGSDMWREAKRDHLQSDEWREIRQRRLKLDKYQCQVCTKNNTVIKRDRLEIHHKTYKNLGNENMRDLASLCREHHQLQHDHHGYYVSGYHKIKYK